MGLFGKLFGRKQSAQPPAGEEPEATTTIGSSSVGDDTPVIGPKPDEPKAPIVDVAPPPPQPTQEAQPPADAQPPAAK